MSETTIRSYRASDRAALLAAFDSNVPEFFGPGERAELLADLDGSNGTFFVADKAGVAMACGGYAIAGDTLSLIWGLVHRAEHGHGMGTKLLEHRLDIARATAGIRAALGVDEPEISRVLCTLRVRGAGALPVLLRPRPRPHRHGAGDHLNLSLQRNLTCRPWRCG